MRIGISILSHQGHSVWENGLVQNVAFLAQSLRVLPFVEDILLLDCGDGTPMPAEFLALMPGCRVVRLADVDTLDLAIEMSGGLDVVWIDRMRARGTRVVWLAAGQPYVALAEAHVFGRPGYFSRAERCDEIWLLPKDEGFAPMMRTLHRCPVRITPYLWSPYFLERRLTELASPGTALSWQTPVGGWRVGIFEPNISVVKSCVVPMLACDLTHRAHPGAIDHMRVYNSAHMTQHRTLLHLANSLDLVKQHRTTFLGRQDIVTALATEVNAVVAHQWCNQQNNLHLDVLHAGFPLVHNAPWLADVGYYYPDFEAEAAARALAQAIAHHAEDLPRYTQAARQRLARLAPTEPANVQAHARLVLALWNQRVPVRSAA